MPESNHLWWMAQRTSDGGIYFIFKTDFSVFSPSYNCHTRRRSRIVLPWKHNIGASVAMFCSFMHSFISEKSIWHKQRNYLLLSIETNNGFWGIFKNPWTFDVMMCKKHNQSEIPPNFELSLKLWSCFQICVVRNKYTHFLLCFVVLMETGRVQSNHTSFVIFHSLIESGHHILPLKTTFSKINQQIAVDGLSWQWILLTLFVRCCSSEGNTDSCHINGREGS